MSEKILRLRDLGLDYFYMHPFNQRTAYLSAEAFCQKILTQLAPKGLVAGHDFHFGKNREGTPQFLAHFCEKNNISCHLISERTSEDHIRYSSQALRGFLNDGDIKAVKSFLNHDYVISGRVQYGHQRARQLGFPTANIILKGIMPPRYGVYNCRILNMDHRIAIANIGVKPTLYDHHHPIMEIHIPHFNGNLYGKKLRISLEAFVRAEQKFSSIDHLKRQIQTDVETLLK